MDKSEEHCPTLWVGWVEHTIDDPPLSPGLYWYCPCKGSRYCARAKENDPEEMLCPYCRKKLARFQAFRIYAKGVK